MKLHSQWISEQPTEIYATGGGSANYAILQVAADIFQTPIRQFDITDSAALGAAFRSLKSYNDFINKKESWNMIVSNFMKSRSTEEIIPNDKNKELYNEMVDLYKKYEDYILRNGEDPEPTRKQFIEKYFSS
jgi:sugar (pentulose or hexulose) kinase